MKSAQCLREETYLAPIYSHDLCTCAGRMPTKELLLSGLRREFHLTAIWAAGFLFSEAEKLQVPTFKCVSLTITWQLWLCLFSYFGVVR